MKRTHRLRLSYPCLVAFFCLASSSSSPFFSPPFLGFFLSASSAAFGFSTRESASTKISTTRGLYGCYDSSSYGDRALVEQQLGYLPSNFVRVSAWTTKTKVPIAIQTYPLQGGAKRRQAKATYNGDSSALQSPFPTLYWLTCPEISKCVADLERLGCLQEFEARLHSNPALAERLCRCHRQYAKERWNALSGNDRALLTDSTEHAVLRMRGIMEESGISGSNLTLTTATTGNESVAFPSIKCLHAHYAHFRSTRDVPGCEKNPVGEMIHQQLLLEFPDVEL